MRLRPDHQWFRSTDGTSLIAGSPLSFFKVSPKGADILSLIESGATLPAGHEPLTQRLVAAGAVHPLSDEPVPPSDITVVIPTFARDKAALQRVTALATSLSDMHVIVVDDCSPQPVAIDGVTVVRHDINQGPGVARNTGFALVSTPFVAFIDDDVTITTKCVQLLAAQMSDDNVALTAPRIISSQNNRLTGDYESLHSPLDLGEHPSLIRPFARVSYVPAATIVCRTDVVRELNGFTTDMRMGEDVDFVWRLVDAGYTCRFEPSLTCVHESRSTPFAMLRQRFGYGTSAATLSATHRQYVSPLRANIVLLVPSVALLCGYVLVSLPLVPVVYAWHLITLRRSGLSVQERARITTQGFSATISLVASAIARVWWPVLLLLSPFFAAAAFALIVSLFVPAVVGVLRCRPRRVFGFLTLRIADNLAYGAGVWWGAIKARSLRCLIPTITRSPLRLRSKG